MERAIVMKGNVDESDAMERWTAWNSINAESVEVILVHAFISDSCGLLGHEDEKSLWRSQQLLLTSKSPR